MLVDATEGKEFVISTLEQPGQTTDTIYSSSEIKTSIANSNSDLTTRKKQLPNHVTSAAQKITNNTGLINKITTTSGATSDVAEVPLNYSTVIVVIGGIIALFLGVIMIQFCVKLHLSRRKKSRRISRNSVHLPEEETYQEINEAVMGSITEQYRKCDNSAKVQKYYEIEKLNSIRDKPYEKMRSQTSQYQDVESEVAIDNSESSQSSTSPNSTSSNTSYLKPKTKKRDRHSYIQVLDTVTPKEDIIQGSPINVDGEGHLNQHNPSSQYIDPISAVVLSGHEGEGYERCGDKSAYLDVMSDSFVESSYLDVVHHVPNN